jgi:glycosyltransferase involved in cell wall biosynthesis
LKKRISIWIHGGIGGGTYAEGQPVIAKVIEELANDYELLIYSQLHPNTAFIPKGFTVYSASNVVKYRWLRWLYLVWQFIINHIKRTHELNYAFWGYPAGVLAVVLGTLFDKPCIVHLQGGDAACIPALQYGAFYRPFSRQLSRWAYTKTKILIALTDYQKLNLDRQGIKRKVEIIPYGPDLTKFKIKERSMRSNFYQFIHIGNHNLLKDQITLLKTFSIISGRLPNSKLRIVGYDALNGELKKFTIQLGIDNLVEFTGPVPYDEIPNHLHDADVILHTSVFEGQATVISEAAASGVLLAGTRVGLLSDLGDRYGIIVDVGDAESLAEKVLNALNDPSMLTSYINNSRKWVEKHDHRWTVQTIKFHIDSLIKNG